MTTISDLSCDLVEEILVRVPITSLGAVRSTCKRWNNLSKSRLLCKAKANQQFLGFMRKNSKLRSLRFDLNEEKFGVKETSNQVDQISEVFVCDGLLLCVSFTRDDDIQHLVVWNPYLGQTRLIQPRTAYDISDIYAIGYDNNRNHKILRYLSGYKAECEIYDFKSDSWRTINLDVTLHWGCGMEYLHFSASLKGNTYFVDYSGFAELYTGLFLCFDFTRESFGEYLHLPWSQDHSYYLNFTPISCFGEEKLAALNMDSSPIFGMEIWVTTKIEPNEVLWSNFLKIDLEAIPRFGARSFFIDEEKKRAVLFSYGFYVGRKAEKELYNEAYIIGENDFFKTVYLGEIKHPHGYFPVVCSNSYVPSLVKIKQKEREEDEASQ